METVALQENKGMTTSTHSIRPSSEETHIPVGSIIESDKNTQSTSKPQKSAGRKFKRFPWTLILRVPYISNASITVIVLLLLYIIEFGYIPGTKSGFVCNDPLISHPYKGDTITPTTLLVGCVLLPLIIIVVVEAIIQNSVKDVRIKDVWFYYVECLIGINFVLLITEIIKVIVGEHRPHFFDVCKPDTNANCKNGTYIDTFVCTNTAYSRYFLIDTSRSFPSGHSSVSVFIGIFCAYVVQTRLPSAKTGRLLKPFLVAVCLTWSLVCSLTRIVDRRHHWWDVLGGMLLGASGAVYTLKLLHKKMYENDKLKRTAVSTTTLLDEKFKDVPV